MSFFLNLGNKTTLTETKYVLCFIALFGFNNMFPLNIHIKYFDDRIKDLYNESSH